MALSRLGSRGVLALALVVLPVAAAAGGFRCQDLDAAQLIAAVQALGKSVGEPPTWTQPGDAMAELVFDGDLTKDGPVQACAAIVWSEEAYRNAAGTRGDGEVAGGTQTLCAERFLSDRVTRPPLQLTTVASLRVESPVDAAGVPQTKTVVRYFIPGVANWRWCEARVVVGVFDDDGDAVAAFNRVEEISSRGLGGVFLAMWVLFALLVYRGMLRNWKQAHQSLAGKLTRWHYPLVAVVDDANRASAANFQVLMFTFIVGAMLAYTIGRLGSLTELSVDVLLLLGISLGGSGVARATESRKVRLSYDNWIWIRRKGWSTTPKDLPQWGQLVTTMGQFDVTKFQMLTFSVVVAFALVVHGSHGLATFDIPDSLLGILGLSQVVYVGGKALMPPNMADYDAKLTTLREAESELIQALAAHVVTPPAPMTTDQAKSVEADKYQAYMALARQAAHMHTQIFRQPVADSAMDPDLPG